MSAPKVAFLLLQKALPLLAKHLPKLWPLLLESKNREKLRSLAGDLSSASPKRKLAGRMDVTEMLAQRLQEEAETEQERQRAGEWQSRARKMRARLDMPVEGLQARRAHRASLHDDLAALHTEMSDALR